MKAFSNIRIYTMFIVLLQVMLISVSCIHNNPATQTNVTSTTPPSTTASENIRTTIPPPPPDEYPRVIDKVSSSAIELTIKRYTSSETLTIDKNEPKFQLILNYLEQSTMTGAQSKIIIVDGKEVQVTSPYAIGYILKFKLSDDSELSFNYGTSLWFETDQTMYSASVDKNLYNTLDELVGSSK